MNDYKEMREGKILLNRFPYNECKDFRRQEQHEKENLYFLTNDDGFFMKMYEAVGNPRLDEVWIEKYYPESKVTERKCIPAKKKYENCEVLEFDTLFENIENVPYLNLKNPVDFLVNKNGCLCIQHVSNSGVMEELRLNCYSQKVTNYLLREARLLRSSHEQEVNNVPERFLVVFADAMDWNNKEKLHKFPNENERLEGIYDNYEDAYKVLEEASRSGIHNLTVEIRREVKVNDEDGWKGLMEPILDVMTTDIHGNISEKETLHLPERKELEALSSKRIFCSEPERISSMKQKEKPLKRRGRGR